MRRGPSFLVRPILFFWLKDNSKISLIDALEPSFDPQCFFSCQAILNLVKAQNVIVCC
ncbi:MAG: hypothetical protein ACI8PB_005504 [Desulforhopalus sp.]|jgi:hypothetical protein